MASRTRRFWLLGAVILAGAVLGQSVLGGGSKDWRTASREPAGLAPDPATTPEAVVQVYSARAVGWRGKFGVHTWIAAKRTDAEKFTVYEVIGYRLRRTGTSVVVHERAADGYWFGNRPELLSDVRGAGVDELITRIEAAVQRYPYAQTYRVWPGPNSNTFTAFVLRDVPELRVDLPPTAIGKDYLGLASVGKTPSGTGAQFSLFGAAGILAGAEEGLELNLLGLTFGVDPASLSIKLPLIGRLGPGGDAEPVILGGPADPPAGTIAAGAAD
ncbi:MAG TPA: DUF3750 domain-containing protein [Povalibacter sp.]|nr:DUF3750 domain-containing protein [Povalibacter sp.]